MWKEHLASLSLNHHSSGSTIFFWNEFQWWNPRGAEISQPISMYVPVEMVIGHCTIGIFHPCVSISNRLVTYVTIFPFFSLEFSVLFVCLSIRRSISASLLSGADSCKSIAHSTVLRRKRPSSTPSLSRTLYCTEREERLSLLGFGNLFSAKSI